jgi:hypothetical protein
LVPEALATLVAAGIPSATAAVAITASTTHCDAAGMNLASANQISTAASDPHVPGPPGSRPIPKNVAVTVAHTGARALDTALFGNSVSVFIGCVGEPLATGVFRDVRHGRRDHVLSAGPLAQIDQLATFAAEREVLRRVHHRLLANKTLQLDLRFGLAFRHYSSIVDGIPVAKVTSTWEKASNQGGRSPHASSIAFRSLRRL